MKSKLVGSRQPAFGRENRNISIAPGFNRGGQLPVGRLRTVVASLQSELIIKLVLITGWLMAVPSALLAQADTTQPHTVDMATTMRSSGKIYVVVAVLSIILVGLFLYLIRLDRKIGKLEKE